MHLAWFRRWCGGTFCFSCFLVPFGLVDFRGEDASRRVDGRGLDVLADAAPVFTPLLECERAGLLPRLELLPRADEGDLLLL